MFPDRTRCLLAILGLGVAAAPTQVGFAQVESLQRGGTGAQRLTPDTNGLAPPADPTRPVEVAPLRGDLNLDTSGIWHYIRLRQLQAARREIARLSAEHPQWRPPLDMTESLTQIEIDGLIRAKALGSLPEIARANPQLFGCDRLGNAIGLAEAHQRRGDRAAAVDVFARVLADCRTPATRKVAIGAAATRLSPTEANALSRRLAGTPAAADLARQAGASAYDAQVAKAAIDIRGKRADARVQADATAREVLRRRDAKGAELLAWAYFDAGEPTSAQQWFERAESWGAPATARQGHIGALTQQGQWQAAEALAAGNLEAQKFLGDQAAAAAGARATAGAWQEAMALAEIADRNGRPDTSTSLGWVALDAGLTAQALRSFAVTPASEEAGYGRLLTLDQAGAPWQDLQAACVTASSARQREACGNGLSSRALVAYRAEKWADVIAIDEAMRALSVAQPGTTALASWSHYRRGEYRLAYAGFDRLYQQGEDVGDGLVLSAMAAGQDRAVAARAATDPKLKALYVTQLRTQALDRKKFLLAESLGDDPGPLRGISQPEAEVSVGFRNKSGTPGNDAISATTVGVRGAMTWNGDRVEVAVSRQSIDPRLGPSTSLYTPLAGWQRETLDSRYAVQAGLSPIGGIVDPTPVGRVQVEHSWSKLIGTLTVKAVPLFDSVLAMSGLRDATTGRTWGRVVEIGPEAGVVYLFTDTLAGSVSAAASSVRGHNVQANGHIAFNASLNYTFKPTGFDFVRVGPTYGFQHYSRNENFFTMGHGGYYSPDQLHSLGAFVEFQTDEAKRWQVAGRVSGGWTHKVEASALQFPLANTGAVFLGARGSEFTTDSVLRGSVMLGDHLRLGLMGRYTQAPSGRDTAGAVVLSVPFGARKATFSSELPRVLDRSWP